MGCLYPVVAEYSAREVADERRATRSPIRCLRCALFAALHLLHCVPDGNMMGVCRSLLGPSAGHIRARCAHESDRSVSRCLLIDEIASKTEKYAKGSRFAVCTPPPLPLLH